MKPEDINWEELKKWSPPFNKCKCGHESYGYVKGIILEGKFVIVLEIPCPKCGESVGNIRSSSTDWEGFTIGE